MSVIFIFVRFSVIFREKFALKRTYFSTKPTLFGTNRLIVRDLPVVKADAEWEQREARPTQSGAAEVYALARVSGI